MANHLLLLALTIFNLHLVCVSPAPKTPPPPAPTTHPPPPLTTFEPPSPTTRPPPPTFSPPPSKSLRPPPQPSQTFPPPPPAKVFSPPPPSISVSPPPQSTDFIPTPSNKAFSPPPPPSSATVSPPNKAALSPPPPPSATVSPPPPPSATVSSPPPPIDGETTLEKIIDAITNNQTEFGIWANLLLSSSSTTTTTATATLFIPSNAAFSHLPTPTTAAINFDPFLIPYHISPTRLSFHNLLHQFKPNSTIPTLLPSKSILITNTSPLNFTIDNSRITRPDIYLSPAFAVHGIQHILDYTLFGDLHFPATTSPSLIPPLDELVGATTTTSDCSAAQLALFFSFLCAAFVFNMLLVN